MAPLTAMAWLLTALWANVLPQLVPLASLLSDALRLMTGL